MTDRELLELAAKAAGIRLAFNSSGDPYAHNGIRARAWNPLTDDGYALRLAVKLGLLFKHELAHFLSLERFAHQDKDDGYATRRAIVRTAAEIGRNMQ